MRDWTHSGISLIYLALIVGFALILVLLILIVIDWLWQTEPLMLGVVLAPVIFILIAYNTPQARARRRAARSSATHNAHHKNANRE